jgi:hypothetical protein
MASNRPRIVRVAQTGKSETYRVPLSQRDIPDGGLACCAIALVAAFSMAKRGTAREVIAIDWEWVLRTGVDLYRSWKRIHAETIPKGIVLGSDEHVMLRGPTPLMITVEDFRRVQDMAPIFECMTGAQEFGGSMRPEVNAEANQLAGTSEPLYMEMEDAVEYMTRLASMPGGSRSAAIVSIGDRTFALWSGGSSNGGGFVLYDSHPEHTGLYEGCSTLYVSWDVSEFMAYIRTRFCCSSRDPVPSTVSRQHASLSSSQQDKNDYDELQSTIYLLESYSAYVFRLGKEQAARAGVVYTI